MPCNCPKGAELYAIIKKNIEESGFHAFYIYDHDEPHKTFFYTIGLTERGLPELFMGVNCKAEVGVWILHDIVNDMAENGVNYKRNDNILDGMDIKLAPVKSEYSIENYLVQLGEYYGRKDIPVVQILMPDVNGKLPDDAGYKMEQIVLPKKTLN